MIIIRNNIIPFGNFGAINLFGVLFAKADMKLTAETINHEKIHSRQIAELLFIPFYLIYIAEWLFRLIQCNGNLMQAYYHISFEKEAYQNADNLSYLNHRRRFAMWRKQPGSDIK